MKSKSLSVITSKQYSIDIFGKKLIMKKHFLFVVLFYLLLIGCSSDEKPIETVVNGIEHGAFLRTLQINNSEFSIDNLESNFSVDIQEQDEEDGGLLQSVNVYVRFLDNTIATGDFSTSEVLIQTLQPSDFSPGSFDLPITTIDYTFNELLETTGIEHDIVECKDQFIIRLELNLSNDFVFSSHNASACILGFDTFFGSPFIYTINIVEPIENELFTGTYLYESILDGPFGPTFGEPFLVEVTNGHSPNVRTVKFDNFPLRLPRTYRFSIVCDELIFEKNQLRYNTLNSPCGEDGQPILLGPDTVNSTINPLDDSVFEIWFVEGYLGWDGVFGFGTVPSRIRLTKQ